MLTALRMRKTQFFRSRTIHRSPWSVVGRYFCRQSRSCRQRTNGRMRVLLALLALLGLADAAVCPCDKITINVRLLPPLHEWKSSDNSAAKGYLPSPRSFAGDPRRWQARGLHRAQVVERRGMRADWSERAIRAASTLFVATHCSLNSPLSSGGEPTRPSASAPRRTHNARKQRARVRFAERSPSAPPAPQA